METKLETIRLILEIGGILVVVYLIIRLKLQAKKHAATFKRNDELIHIIRFLDEVSKDNQNGLDFTLLSKIPAKDLKNFEDKLTAFYQKKFYSQLDHAKKLGKFLFFVNDCVCDDSIKEIIKDNLEEATKKVELEKLATITTELIIDKAKGVGLVKLSKDFILQTIYNQGYGQALIFLEHFENEIARVLNEEILTHQEKGIIALEALVVKNYFK